jgi:hypothetical protein
MKRLKDYKPEPIAPDPEQIAKLDKTRSKTGVRVGIGTAAWALDCALSGLTMKRAGWVGAKILVLGTQPGKITLTDEDIRAQDWVIA